MTTMEERILRKKHEHIFLKAEKLGGNVPHPFKLCLQCLNIIHAGNESECPLCRKDEDAEEYTSWSKMRKLVLKEKEKEGE